MAHFEISKKITFQEDKGMDSKKKKLIAIGSVAAVIVIAVILVLTLVCFHSWKEATCDAPMTCEKCGETKGDALVHEWIEATCTEARHCVLCGLSQGTPLEHKWKDATCVTAKTCADCNKTDGKPLGHAVKEWEITKETSCSTEGERIGTCERCKKDCKEKIDKLPHTESDWTVKKDYVFNPDGTVVPGTEAIVCTVCKAEIKSREYTTELTLSQKNAVICAYDEISFWHCGPSFLIHDVLVDFNDFSVSDSKLAVEHMTVDWDEQAVLYAKENCEGSSRAGLAEEMRYYGFNNAQIEKALKEVGY